MTLICADLRWDQEISIIASLRGENLQDEDFQSRDFFTRCNYLNLNPVLLARHFQYRVETFFQVIILDGPLGKVKHHAIRIEFQVRGSPHVHSFLWVLDAPTLSKDHIHEYILFVDSIVNVTLPNLKVHPGLFDLVTTYQIHSHSQFCHKYKIQTCRYHFGKSFTMQTIIAQPLPNEISDEEKNMILEKQNTILGTVKKYIDENLNPKKCNITDPRRENYVNVSSISEILEELKILVLNYYEALSISSDDDFKI